MLRQKKKLSSRPCYGGKQLAAASTTLNGKLKKSEIFYSSQNQQFRSIKCPIEFSPSQQQKFCKIPTECTSGQQFHVSKRPFDYNLDETSPDKSHSVKRLKIDSPDGYTNLGNTCYLNAVLQSLLGLRCFAIDIVQSKFSRMVNSKSLFSVLRLLIKCKYNGENLKSQIILIRQIRDIICNRAHKFVGFNEQDAHELLSYCLDILRTDIIDIKDSDVCPVEINFKSCIEQTLLCTTCNEAIVSHEDVYFLSLHFTKSHLNSLQDLIEDYFKAEIVEYKCVNCGNQSCNLVRKFSQLPRVLILTLKRYTIDGFGGCDKSLEPVRIPRCINMSLMSKFDVRFPPPYDDSKDILRPLMGLMEKTDIETPTKKKTSLNYKLTSIISHIGKSSSSGHYVSEVYCPINNVWWHCNDSVITKTTEEYVRQIHQTKAYILFYIHH